MGKGPIALFAIGLAATLLGGCSSVVRPGGGSPTYSPPAKSRTIHIDVRDGCPTGLGHAEDVRNSDRDTLRLRLVRRDPTSAIVCAYRASDGHGPTRLTDRVRLGRSDASELADALAKVEPHEADGDVACPAQFFGAVTVIALHYPSGPDEDVWYETSGCRTLRNGFTYRGEVGNKSFYDGFESVFDRLAPTRSTTDAAPKPPGG